MSRRVLLPADSRYHRTDLFQLVDEGGNETNTFLWGVWNPILFEETPNDIVYTVELKDLGRLDLLAHRFYNNVNLWWVIASHNLIRDPLLDMQVGQRLRIVAKDSVYATLLNAERQILAQGVSR